MAFGVLEPADKEQAVYDSFKNTIRSYINALSDSDRQEVVRAIKATHIDFKTLFFHPGPPLYNSRELGSDPTEAIKSFGIFAKKSFDDLDDKSKKALSKKLTHQDIADAL